MAERKKQRMYFVREPSQAQSSDKLDAEIASLIEKATKHREQLDKLDVAFNEARVSPGRLGKILERRCNVPHRPAPLQQCGSDLLVDWESHDVLQRTKRKAISNMHCSPHSQ